MGKRKRERRASPSFFFFFSSLGLYPWKLNWEDINGQYELMQAQTRSRATCSLSLFLPSRVRFDDVDTRFPSAVLFFSPLFPPFPCSFLLNLPVSCKFYFSAAAFNITTVLSSFFRCQIIFTLTYTHAQTHTLAQTHIVARENSYINTHKYTYIYI